MDYRKAKYLDPKNDLTFRKIFGQHNNIMKSFLNSLLPLDEGQYIESLIYQDPGLIPELPELKHSIVDVKCTDNFGRQFIVEMQMYWTDSFKDRMLFNSGKAFVKQLDRGQKYAKLLPVYGLSLVNDIYLPEPEHENKFYHHYKLLHHEISEEVIDGIELIFIELPKFKATTFTEKRLQNLWLRFLTEIDENTSEVADELLSSQEITEALEQLQISAFSKEELNYYDDYWDKISVERSAIEDLRIKMDKIQEEKQKVEQEMLKAEQEKLKAEQEMMNVQEEKQKAEKKESEIRYKLAKKMKEYGESIADIQNETGLTAEEIQQL